MVFLRTRVGGRHSTDEQGAVAILTALVMVVLMLCAAIVVDLGLARDVRRQSQNASDAASLAGANALYHVNATGACPLGGAKPCIADAVAAVKLYALNNFQVKDSDWTLAPCPTAVVPSGYYAPDTSNKCILLDNGTPPTRVLVQMPTRPVATFFGRFAGSSSIDVGSSAEAVLKPAVTCSLCFLGSVDPINGDLSVNGGSIAVNVNATAGSNSFWNADSIGVAGTTTGDPTNFTPRVTPIDHFGDPLLSSLTLPLSTTGPPALTDKTDPCSSTATGGPGLYGDFSLPNSTCTLKAGLYVINGVWDMQNNTFLDGRAGVTLYVQTGYLDFKNGTVSITPPATGVSAGYAIIYSRDNANELYLQGNGSTLVSGKVYAPASSLIFNGNSCFRFSGGPIVLKNAETNGNKSCITVLNASSTEVNAAKLHLDQ